MPRVMRFQVIRQLQAIDARIQGNMRLEVVTGVPDRSDFDPGVSIEPPAAAKKTAPGTGRL